MSNAEKLELLLKIQSCNKTVQKLDNFMVSLESKYKDFEEAEVMEEFCTIENLLGIIEQLNNKLESLIDDYNQLIDDCAVIVEDCYDLLPEYDML